MKQAPTLQMPTSGYLLPLPGTWSGLQQGAVGTPTWNYRRHFTLPALSGATWDMCPSPVPPTCYFRGGQWTAPGQGYTHGHFWPSAL